MQHNSRRNRIKSIDQFSVMVKPLPAIHDTTVTTQAIQPGAHAVSPRHQPEEGIPSCNRPRRNTHTDDLQDSLAVGEQVLEAEKGIVIVDDSGDFAPLTTLTLDTLLTPVGSWEVIPTQTTRLGASPDPLTVAVEIYDNDDSITCLRTAVEYDPNTKPPLSQRRRAQAFLVAALTTLIVAVIVGLFVGDDPSPTLEPTITPTWSPSSSRQHMYKEAFSKLVGEIVFDRSTTYYRAAFWIIHDDPLEVSLQDPTLMQRYTAILFYMFTVENAGPWKACNPSNETSKCTYQSISDSPDRIFGDQIEAARWLSGSHECEWLGVTCDEVNFIRELNLALGIGGTIPSEIGDLPHLNVLKMPFNEFTGTIPQSLVNEKMLRLELHDNFLAGDISSFFLGFDQLQVLSLNKNMFSGSIPSAIGALTNLKGLFLSYNILSGSIPSQISLCKNLIFANLDWNQFIGQIPTETGLLTQLHELWARRNLFSGTLPSEIGNMFKLESLRLQGGNLTGSIPKELYNADRLRQLELIDMQLTGVINSRVMNLQGLRQFRLRGNELSGEIPATIGAITGLELAWFHLNHFSGTMPMAICRLRSASGLTKLDADCIQKEGNSTFECDCCTVCCARDTAVCLKNDH